MKSDTAIIFCSALCFFVGLFVGRDTLSDQHSEIARHISAQCNSVGYFTSDGNQYRCAAITQETLNESYRRQFEHCRQWLHNPWRDREMP